jgi:hypothetical protein
MPFILQLLLSFIVFYHLKCTSFVYLLEVEYAFYIKIKSVLPHSSLITTVFLKRLMYLLFITTTVSLVISCNLHNFSVRQIYLCILWQQPWESVVNNLFDKFSSSCLLFFSLCWSLWLNFLVSTKKTDLDRTDSIWTSF